MVGCKECDGTSDHFGHGHQAFLYKNMSLPTMIAKKVTITAEQIWSPAPGDWTLDPASARSLVIKQNCVNPTMHNATICDPRLRTMNTMAKCGSPEDIYYFSPW